MNKLLKSSIAVGIVSLSLFTITQIALADPGNGASLEHIPACPHGQPKTHARCHAEISSDSHGTANVSSLPSGLSPAQLQGAYGLSTTSSNKTIAIVDAYDHPRIRADLTTYTNTFGMPAFPTCANSSQTGCFMKVDQRGGTKYPAFNSGWGLEIALDVEAAHAACPGCKIILVEADSPTIANLVSAENTAASLGANSISNSWGANEFSSQTQYDSNFNKPGVAVTASSGDAGYGVSWPASNPNVVAVGGTTLSLSGNSYAGETAWSGSGSGCSQYESKPSFQHDSCANRTVSDVSAVANPSTGFAVYDSCYQIRGRNCYGGWYKVGGTSLASPIIAAVYAIAGDVGLTEQANSLPYARTINLHDVVSGSNGNCGGSYLCTGVSGYDGPTGLGSPNGVGAF